MLLLAQPYCSNIFVLKIHGNKIYVDNKIAISAAVNSGRGRHDSDSDNSPPRLNKKSSESSSGSDSGENIGVPCIFMHLVPLVTFNSSIACFTSM